jgi:hypothetical protein
VLDSNTEGCQANPKGKGSSHEDQDQHESRQRTVGQLGFEVSQNGSEGLTEVIEQEKSQEGATPMKVKTNTKAGNALWGS